MATQLLESVPTAAEILGENIGRSRFPGAIMTARIFRVLGALEVAGAVTAFFLLWDDSAELAFTIAIFNVMGAALIAFFAHVLEILVGAYSHLYHLRFGDREEEA